jgi:hypothetical protein
MSANETQPLRTFPWVSAGELRTAKRNETDPTEIFKDRFLCRGGGMLLVSNTGQGKSTLICQAAYLWACGKTAFGLKPTRPIKTLIIQAENDEWDLKEMVQGVEKGFNSNQLSTEDVVYGDTNLRIVTESSCTGSEFIKKVRIILTEFRNEGFYPDLLVVDPVISYLGGDPNKAEIVSMFLRSEINPLATEFDFATICVAHTSKPSNQVRTTLKTPTEDVYSALGSVEWANWARAILVLKPHGGGMFELKAVKRGARLGWTTPVGDRAFAQRLAHARDGIYWVTPTDEEFQKNVEMASGAKRLPDADEFLALFPTTFEGIDGLGSTLTSGMLKSEFGKRGWKKDEYVSFRDEAEGRGDIAALPGCKHNEKRYARSQLISQIIKTQEKRKREEAEAKLKLHQKDLPIKGGNK